MNFINIPRKSSVNGEEYLFNYEIKVNNQIIGVSNVFQNDNTDAFLNIEIYKLDNKIYFAQILMQSILKYINLVGSKGNQKLFIILPNNAYYEIFIVMAQNFVFVKNYDSKRLYQLSVDDNIIDTLRNSLSKIALNKYSSTKLKGYDKSYIISAAKINGLIYTTLQNYLNSNELVEISDKMSHPFLLWIELLENYKFDANYFDTKCYLMNILNDNKIIISNKANLYFNFNKYYPTQCEKYMARSWYIDEFINNDKLIDLLRANKNKDNDSKSVYIVRPAGIGAFSGKSIYMVDDVKSLMNARDNTRKYEKVIISKYINNPLLLDGKKMHLRVYFLVALIDEYIATTIFDFYEVFTAQETYKNSDYHNKDIHDTHAKGNDKEIIYPFDIIDSTLYNDYINTYLPKIKDCLTYVSKFIKGRINRFPQAKNAFEIFGCDFLITRDNNVILMEINDKVGYKCQSINTTMRLSKLYFETLIKYIFKPILTNTHLEEQDWLYLSKI